MAAPRGYCAGVDRAIQAVERALSVHGPPVYVRKQIVHNAHVVERLRRSGVVFVEDEREVPPGAVLVFSAHGIAPEVRARAAARELSTIDATCPLVTKVHVEARKFVAAGYTVVLIGHAGHEEVVGTMGEAPGHTLLVESEGDVDDLDVPDPGRVAYLTQTTLSVWETERIIAKLRSRFPAIVGPKSSDICYATTNRQLGAARVARMSDLLLVIGSSNSSNANRLVDVALECGTQAHLIANASQVREAWLAGKRVIGVTSGASVPEELVQKLVDWFRARGTVEVKEVEVAREETRFMLPKEVREDAPREELRERVVAP